MSWLSPCRFYRDDEKLISLCGHLVHEFEALALNNAGMFKQREPAVERRSNGAPVSGRRLNRRSTLLQGKLVYGSGYTLDCKIANFSDNGARVQVHNMQVVGRELYLVHPRDAAAYRARVAWRFGRNVGLQFLDKIDLNRPSASPEQEVLRTLWLEIQPRPFALCTAAA